MHRSVCACVLVKLIYLSSTPDVGAVGLVLLQALTELRLMEWIGERMSDMITSVDTEHRLTAAVVIIVWISALVSSFIDNIPYTTAMVGSPFWSLTCK